MLNIIFTILALSVLIILPTIHLYNSLSASRNKKSSNGITAYNKGMSILIPCYNEEGILETAIEGMKNIVYKNCEIIYINDGSKDETMAILRKLLELTPHYRKVTNSSSSKPVRGFYKSEKYPNVYVIDKDNGGKADSLNAGTSYSSKELVITLDADSILAKNALDVINSAFQDANVIAAGGMVHIMQGRDFTGDYSKISLKLKSIVKLQILEYLKGFYVLKASMAKANALAIISGAFGVFNRDVLIKVGGFRITLGEDIDITLRFQEYIQQNKGKKMLFLPEAECFTECPEDWHDLYKQRVRWQKSFIDAVVQFRKMFFTTFFVRSVSFFFVTDAFIGGTLSSYIALFSIVYLGFHPEQAANNPAFWYLIASTVTNFTYSVVAISLAKKHGNEFAKGNFARLCGVILLDLTIFRFISMFFTAYGSIAYFFNKHDWNKVARTGNNYAIKKEINMAMQEAAATRE